jgi:hypothetical protein
MDSKPLYLTKRTLKEEWLFSRGQARKTQITMKRSKKQQRNRWCQEWSFIT